MAKEKSAGLVHTMRMKHMDLSVAVWGNKETPQPTKIDSGTFDFPFELAIPAQCPPTFNTFTGDIECKQILI